MKPINENEIPMMKINICLSRGDFIKDKSPLNALFNIYAITAIEINISTILIPIGSSTI